MKRFLLPLALVCLLIAACGSSDTPASKLEGTWTLDTDATMTHTLTAMGMKADDPNFAQAKEAAKTQMASMLGETAMTFDTAKKTISGKMMGQAENNTPYTVKSEEAGKVVITTGGVDLPIEINSADTLSIKAGGAVLVLKKK